MGTVLTPDICRREEESLKGGKALELARDAKAAMRASKDHQEEWDEGQHTGKPGSLKAEADALGGCSWEICIFGKWRRPDHKEGQDDIRLLDGLMERGR